MEEAKHSAELKRNHQATNVIGEELNWRNASCFSAQNRWKCEEEIFLKKKEIKITSSRRLFIKKMVRKTFA